MKKRKLIEYSQEWAILCDNPQCDYKIPNAGNNAIILSDYINIPCPKCGNNLLTFEDYLNAAMIMRKVDWLNKWFSWITYFVAEKKDKGTVSVHCYNGIKIEKQP